MSRTLQGGCRCGAVRVAARAEPFWCSWCHCSDCRKATGAPATVFVGFRDADLDIAGSSLAVHRNDPVERLFCRECGTPVGYRDSRLAGETYLYLGVMDRPGRFRPTRHAFVSERLPFVSIDDGLPRFERFSIERLSGAERILEGCG